MPNDSKGSRGRELLKFVAVVLVLLVVAEVMLWLLLWTMSNVGSK